MVNQNGGEVLQGLQMYVQEQVMDVFGWNFHYIHRI
jgi:hypothetical protein